MSGYDPDIINKLIHYHDEACMGAEYVPLSATIFGEALQEIFHLQQSLENMRVSVIVGIQMYSNVIDKLKAAGLTNEEIWDRNETV